ncbi:sarcospan [Periophthalmus magnuspinnatus]|uniref:sarcospan n=1 Tax=Periophthalmus magnuspinnatus TaxID=409849 RepID=UPI00145A5F83|nr:sarcospan [Periophthalmus magnuspinnatus]
MGRGQKGSSDMEKLKMREESPEPERGGCRKVCRFPLLLALLQLLLGVAVAVVAFLKLSITSSLLVRETPHWAGIILCLVSVVGLVLYCVTSHPDERSFLQYTVKLLYFILCSIGLVISVLVIAFAGHHYTQATSFACERKGPTCVCTMEPQDPIARTFSYLDVDDCGYLTSDLPMFFLIQILLNLAQALVCAAACFIMWKNRYQVFFAGLQIPSWQKV